MLSHVWPFEIYGPQPSRLLCPWDSPSKNTGVGCCALLQGIKPMSLRSPALASGFFTSSGLGSPPKKVLFCQNLGLNKGPLDLQSNTLSTELFQPQDKLVKVCKMFPWILWAILANYQIWGGSCRSPWLYSWLVRSTGGLNLLLASEVEVWEQVFN